MPEDMNGQNDYYLLEDPARKPESSQSSYTTASTTATPRSIHIASQDPGAITASPGDDFPYLTITA